MHDQESDIDHIEHEPNLAAGVDRREFQTETRSIRHTSILHNLRHQKSVLIFLFRTLLEPEVLV